MKSVRRYRIVSLAALFDLILSAAGFISASWAYSFTADAPLDWIWTSQWVVALTIASVSFWLSIPLCYSGTSDVLRHWIEQFFAALGCILVVQSALGYLFVADPLPWAVVIAGTVVTIASMIAVREVVIPALRRDPQGIVFAGMD